MTRRRRKRRNRNLTPAGPSLTGPKHAAPTQAVHVEGLSVQPPRPRRRPPAQPADRSPAPRSTPSLSLAQPPREEPELALFEQRLGYQFRSQRLLEQALEHASAAREQGKQVVESQRLEFLGDAVLGFLVGEMIYLRAPNLAEGPMSRLRAALVQEATLAERARSLRLPEEVRLGKGEEGTGGRDKPSIQSDVYESVLAAIYLDGGIDAARAFVERQFTPLLEREIGRGKEGPIEVEAAASAAAIRDPKTSLQEWLQARRQGLPVYRQIDAGGPAHARRFRVEVVIEGSVAGSGEGPSKRLAEARAALAALRSVRRSKGRERGAAGAVKEGRVSSGRAARGEKGSRGSRRGRGR